MQLRRLFADARPIRGVRQRQGMRAGEGTEPRPHGGGELVDLARIARAERDDADRQREEIFDAMVHLPQEQVLLLFGAAPVGDVARDFRGADDLTFRIADRRYGQRDFDEAAVLAAPDRVVMFDALAAANAAEDER